MNHEQKYQIQHLNWEMIGLILDNFLAIFLQVQKLTQKYGQKCDLIHLQE